MPMWRVQAATAQGAITFARYNGSLTTYESNSNSFAIYNSPVVTISYNPNDLQAIPNVNQEWIARVTFDRITFTNGSATVSTSDGTLYSR